MGAPVCTGAARVKENCFSFSFIAAPSCQTGPRASTGKLCRFSGSFAPSPRAWAGASGQAARQCARSSAIPWQTGPEEAGAGHKAAFKPAWKTTGLSRSAHSRSPGWGRRRHKLRASASVTINTTVTPPELAAGFLASVGPDTCTCTCTCTTSRKNPVLLSLI